MKTVKLLSLLFVTAIMAVSCDAIQVNSDYDDTTDFKKYNTYGFFDQGIEKAEISDLDKKRILNAIEAEMQKKGFTKSDNPAVLINFFTRASKEVDINQWGYGGYWGWGYGYGWGPYWGGGYTTVSTSVEGTLFIDVIDATRKELVWQGVGSGTLTQDRDKKQARIKEFVSEILNQYPPQQLKEKKEKKKKK